MHTLVGAGPTATLIVLWLIIWLLVQTQDLVKDKPSEWLTSLLETGDFKKVSIWSVRRVLLAAVGLTYTTRSKTEESEKVWKLLRYTCEDTTKDGRKGLALTKRNQKPSVLVAFCCCDKTRWPEMTSRGKHSFWLKDAERKSTAVGKAWQQVTEAGSWETSAPFTQRKQGSELDVEEATNSEARPQWHTCS